MRKSIEALFPRTRAQILSALLLRPEQWWFLTDLAKHLRLTPSTLQRDLARLTEAGILLRRIDGKRVYFKADENCPFLPELQGLFLKTSGLVDIVVEALKPLRSRIQTALVFGSIARGEELSHSDVDLLIIGELGLADLTPYLKKAESRLRREIQAIVYRPEEFAKKLNENDHFLTSIFSDGLLPIFGDINEQLEKARK